MKRTSFVIMAGVVGFVIAWVAVSQRSADELARARAQWATEKSALQAALNQAGIQEPVLSTVIEKKKIVHVREQISPQEIIDHLQQIKISSGPGQIKNSRVAIQQFENLISLGAPALPAIRNFLLRNEEIDYESSIGPKASRDGKISTEFTLPPSLRFGLFDAVKQIGGSDAEKLLADILSNTGRGAEVAYLARALQEIAPNKYRELSVNAARDLLARPLTAGTAGLDKYDREYLYGVLALYGDTSFVGDAQSQLVRADGGIDRGALKYLQQTVGAQAVPSLVQAYQNPALDPSKKEPLARYALTFAGADPQATEFWRQTISDTALPMDHRSELIEDLNQDGLQNERNPTAQDARLITNRLALIDTLRDQVADNPRLTAAWAEAQKDLLDMLRHYQTNSNPQP
jgi:hypothetical protein